MGHESIHTDSFEKQSKPERLFSAETRKVSSVENKPFEFNQPVVLANAKFDRILDLFTDPDIEDPKMARKDLVKMTSLLFLLISLFAGFVLSSVLAGILIGLGFVGFYLWLVKK